MEISAVAASVSANAATKVQAEASVRVLKMAMDMQARNAMHLLEVLPAAAPAHSSAAVSGGAGGVVDTWA